MASDFSDISTQIQSLQRIFTSDEIHIGLPDGNCESNWQLSIAPKGSFFKLNFAVPSKDTMGPIGVTLDASEYIRLHNNVTEDKVNQVQEYLSEMANETSGVPEICKLVDATMDFLLILSDSEKTICAGSPDQLDEMRETSCDKPAPNSFKVNDANHPRMSPISTVVCKFYLEGRCRFGDQCINLHIGDAKEQKGSKKAKNIDKESKKNQKHSMKTAIDVINRILWDDSLPTDRFRIGYLDRFLGVLEKPFICFSWEDISSVDYTTLAIPKHRIQYFKYRTAKVWDKNERIDHVFGSTGSEKNIYDLMSQVDIEYEMGPPESSRGFSALMSSAPGQEQGDIVEPRGYCGGSDVDTDDDGIEITIRDNPRPDTASSYPDADRPNYFLAAHVTDPEILDNVRVVTDHMVSQDPRLTDSLIPRHRLHLTTCMFRLDSLDEVADAVAAVRDLPRHVPPPSASIAHRNNTTGTITTDAHATTIAAEITTNAAAGATTTTSADTTSTTTSAATQRHLHISYRGLDTFFGRVVYMRPSTEDSDSEATALVTYVQRLSDYFEKRGVRLAPGFAYVPHVTLAKKTRQMTRETFSMYIDPSVYAQHQGHSFGSQPLTELFLHPCGEQLGPEDPYRIVAHASLVNPELPGPA